MVQELSHQHHRLIYILYFSDNFNLFPYNFQLWMKFSLKNDYCSSFCSIILIVYFSCSSAEFQVKVKHSEGVFYWFQCFWVLKFTVFASWQKMPLQYDLVYVFIKQKYKIKIQTYTFHRQ